MKPKFIIIISPAKKFNNLKPTFANIKTTFSKQAKQLFKEIDFHNQQLIKKNYKVSDTLASQILDFNQKFDKEVYPAINLYGGLVFKQLQLDKIDKQWLNNHVIILDALYGIIKPLDLISKYRLDFQTKINIDLKDFWKETLNKYLAGYEIFNLASSEFSSLIDHKMHEIKLEKNIKQIKIARGKTLNNILLSKKPS